MSRQIKSVYADPANVLGEELRQLREERGEPLRAVAAGVEMDSTLLSKIELGHRVPTENQARALAGYFGIPADELEARCIAARFWRQHGSSNAGHRAIRILRERADAYTVDN